MSAENPPPGSRAVVMYRTNRTLSEVKMELGASLQYLPMLGEIEEPPSKNSTDSLTQLKQNIAHFIY